MNFIQIALGTDVPNKKQDSKQENVSLTLIHNTELGEFTGPSVTCLAVS